MIEDDESQQIQVQTEEYPCLVYALQYNVYMEMFSEIVKLTTRITIVKITTRITVVKITPHTDKKDCVCGYSCELLV